MTAIRHHAAIGDLMLWAVRNRSWIMPNSGDILDLYRLWTRGIADEVDRRHFLAMSGSILAARVQMGLE